MKLKQINEKNKRTIKIQDEVTIKLGQKKDCTVGARIRKQFRCNRGRIWAIHYSNIKGYKFGRIFLKTQRNQIRTKSFVYLV